MNIEKSIYPYNPEARELPLFLSGIGGSNFQKEVSRPDGYQWHQILFCTLGTGVMECNHTTHQINPGEYIFLPKNLPHRYYPVSEKWGVSWLAFEGYHCDEILAKLKMTDFFITALPPSAMLEKNFEKMIHSQETDFLYCDHVCSGLLYDYLLEFHRYTNSSADSERSRLISLLLPALQYMHSNYKENTSMVELSNLIGISPEHFSRIFKKALNTTPTNFLTAIRINEAKRILSQTDTSIATIAQETGFNDAGYFCTVFKKHEGVSPSEYRETGKMNLS